ncbi:metallophosphoesterase [Streptomyces sp. YC504]|uniref:Metallophosphoesterase n=1 Tax=Streptomyces mesophilus TaxID=1775132 RepID=A0A6G4XR34_9ACTN|nr:metallophosphoesterase [Streptomyces mesophilus]NGO79164.1 metallophosphoesterase [Streptomyces mesophilus]
MIVLFVLAGLAAFSALLGLHYYLWRRLVRDTTTAGSTARKAGTAALVTALVLMVAAFAGARAGLPFGVQQVFAWPGYLWMALFLYLTLSLLVGEAVRPLLLRWLRKRDAAVEPVPVPEVETSVVREAVGVGGEGGGSGSGGEAAAPVADRAPELEKPALAAPSRRLFVSRIIGGAAATAAVATVGYGTYGVLRGPKLKHLTVPLARLPRGAHGFRIAVVSDIHLGPVLGRAHTQRIVDTINSTQADLVAVVGDLVDGSVEDLGPAAEPLAQLRSRHGSFFVTGNHEYFSGAQQWVDHVRELGLHPLENARVEIDGFDLAGVNDVAGESEGQGPDFLKALGDRDRSRASVLLAHQPVVIHDAVEHGVDLQLSGHTHGGQMWPGNLIADLANPTLAGLESYGDTQLYVTRGAGAWGPPVRVGAPSDITVVTLASKRA